MTEAARQALWEAGLSEVCEMPLEDDAGMAYAWGDGCIDIATQGETPEGVVELYTAIRSAVLSVVERRGEDLPRQESRRNKTRRENKEALVAARRLRSNRARVPISPSRIPESPYDKEIRTGHIQ